MYKDLIAQLRLFETVCRHSEKPDIADLARRAWQVIEKLQTPQWIPVTERPKNPHGLRREYFLVALESGCVESLGYDFDCNRWHISGSPVTHWMPLPEPPEEEKI